MNTLHTWILIRIGIKNGTGTDFSVVAISTHVASFFNATLNNLEQKWPKTAPYYFFRTDCKCSVSWNSKCVFGCLWRLKIISILQLPAGTCGSTENGGAGIREPKIRDEWLGRWGIMGNTPVSEGMASRGNSEEDRFRLDERGSWLSTLLLCVGSGSASKSSHSERRVE